MLSNIRKNTKRPSRFIGMAFNSPHSGGLKVGPEPSGPISLGSRTIPKYRDGLKINQTGFTLIELVVVILLTGVLVAAITPFIHTNVMAFIRIRIGKDIAQGARVGLLRMTEELKRATQITDSSPSEIEFDFQETDGSTTRSIKYKYQGEFLTRGDNEAIIAAVQGFHLTYYAESGSITTITSAIRLIQIEIDVGASSEEAATIRTCVRPRNI